MGYKNFTAAIYCTVHDLLSIKDLNAFQKELEFMEKHIGYSKVYLETYRSGELISKEKMLAIKKFFNSKGIKTSGGITATPRYNTNQAFETFCFTNESHRSYFRDIVKFTADIFDEVILDDFFFTNCKCERCIKAKGNKDWASFRLELLKEISEDIVNTAKAVNPNVNMIIKYPNWYDDYQNTGYNLKDQPGIFDMVYTGTETRDPEGTQQHLQRYLSYFLMRYIENVKPGKNGGGWFDAIDCMYNIGSFAEQAYLTLFSKAREVTLFCLSLLLSKHSVFVPLAGYAFERADLFLDRLGNPVGIPCYKPYNSQGENYLHSYLGMLGLPLEPSPFFSEDSAMILLTSSAAKDPDIITKVKNRLIKGKNVLATSGFIKSVEGADLEDIASVRYTDKKASVNKFAVKTYDCAYENYICSAKEILIPRIDFGTNDFWPIIAGIGEKNSFSLLSSVNYGKGTMYILTVPDDFGDLYNLPREVLSTLRELIAGEIFVKIDAESQVGLFAYDNDTFVIESFLPHNTTVNIAIRRPGVKLLNLDAKNTFINCMGEADSTGNTIEGITVNGETEFKVHLYPNSFQVFKCI